MMSLDGWMDGWSHLLRILLPYFARLAFKIRPRCYDDFPAKAKKKCIHSGTTDQVKFVYLFIFLFSRRLPFGGKNKKSANSGMMTKMIIVIQNIPLNAHFSSHISLVR